MHAKTLKDLNPGMTGSEVIRIVSQKWAKLTDEQKGLYELIAVED